MKKFCSCYEYSLGYNHGLCNGTKERDLCSCGGDEAKCDFYPEKKKEAKKESVKGKFDLLELIDNCMKKKDRYITIFIGDAGTSVSIYPYTEQEDNK